MKAKHTIIFLMILVFFSAPAFARDRIVDNAGLLSSGEKAQLSKLMDAIAAAYNFDLVIVTEKDIGSKSPMDYADDFFDYNGYGLGEDRDGCLFLQVTRGRDYWFSTSGRGMKLLDGNSTAFNKLEADVLRHLKTDQYFSAYEAFINNMEKFLSLEARGRSYNLFYEMNLIFTVVAWVIAFIIGLLIVSGWKRKMDTAFLQTHASAYIVPGSLVFKEQKDRFLFSRVTKIRRQTQSSSGGSHSSSSGRSHGGRGGKY